MTAVVEAARHVLLPRTVIDRRPGRDNRIVRLSGLTMGTSWSASFYAPGAAGERAIAGKIASALDRVVRQMSTWLPSSDISRYNAASPGSWLELPDAFFQVLTAALDVAQASDGAYDPAVGALVQAWGFGSDGPRTTPPADDEVERARKAGNWRRVEIDAVRRRVRQPGGLQLDLSSIAKGFGVDEIGRCLEREGIVSYLCEIGGELRGAGMKPDGSPWWVGLESPPGTGVTETVVALHGLSVATSGDYVRNYADARQRYGHTLDPRTGRPLLEGVSTSVVAGDCMTADAWATALSVLGMHEGLRVANRHGVAARLVGGAGPTAVFSVAARALMD